MLYLVIEILLFVILAGLVGLACGWVLRGGKVGQIQRSSSSLEAEIVNKNEALYQVRSQLAAATSLLRERAETDETLRDDPKLVALLTGRYRRAEKANGAGVAEDGDRAVANGNGALPLGRRLGQARSLRRPSSRRTRWSSRVQKARRGGVGAGVR